MVFSINLESYFLLLSAFRFHHVTNLVANVSIYIKEGSIKLKFGYRPHASTGIAFYGGPRT